MSAPMDKAKYKDKNGILDAELHKTFAKILANKGTVLVINRWRTSLTGLRRENFVKVRQYMEMNCKDVSANG